MAKTILSSVKQFAEESPTKGMWWPSVSDRYSGSIQELSIASAALVAMHNLNPDDSDIDKVRQWLILQKEVQDWGSSSAVSDIVYAIITTSPSWQQPSTDASVSVGEKAFVVPSGGTGELKVNLRPAQASNAEVNIIRKSSSPAWGAVTAIRFMSMDSIKAQSSDAVSITKSIYRKDGTQWVNADTLHLGDIVKVSLLINARQTLDYAAIDDNRGACLEPVDQLPGYLYSQGIGFYRENLDASTNIFVSNLPKGVYILEYEMFVNNAGTYSSGIASLQSQYQPSITAHSSSHRIIVKP